jgi:hypothetical protein
MSLLLCLSTAYQTQQQKDRPVRIYGEKGTNSAQPKTRDQPRIWVRKRRKRALLMSGRKRAMYTDAQQFDDDKAKRAQYTVQFEL